MNVCLALSVPLPPLADSSGTAGAIGWSLVLLGLAIAGFYGVVPLRRWMKEEDVPAGGIGFTLSDLRQLHREGKMTDAEFERAREKMVSAAREMAARLPDPLARERKQPPR